MPKGTICNILVSPVRGERFDVRAAPIAPGGIIGDRKFKAPMASDCSCKQKNSGSRDLLIVDREFTQEPGARIEEVALLVGLVRDALPDRYIQ